MTGAEIFHISLMVLLATALVAGGIYFARNDTARRDDDR